MDICIRQGKREIWNGFIESMNMVVTLGLKGGVESRKKFKPEEESGENQKKKSTNERQSPWRTGRGEPEQQKWEHKKEIRQEKSRSPWNDAPWSTVYKRTKWRSGWRIRNQFDEKQRLARPPSTSYHRRRAAARDQKVIRQPGDHEVGRTYAGVNSRRGWGTKSAIYPNADNLSMINRNAYLLWLMNFISIFCYNSLNNHQDKMWQVPCCFTDAKFYSEINISQLPLRVTPHCLPNIGFVKCVYFASPKSHYFGSFALNGGQLVL